LEFDLLILSIEYDFSMAETNKHRGSAQKSADLTPVDECYPPAASVGMLKTFLASVLSSDCRIQFAVLVFVLLWYGAFLSISWRWALNDPERLTFNSMLAHLLRGQFDVDPQIVSYEGYARDGRVYSYFGIWCALLRLPLWVVNRMNVDMTFWSCFAAACLASMAKLRAVLLIRRCAIRGPIASHAMMLFLAYILLAGSAVVFLQVSIYLEVILWAYAFATVFVYLALKGIVNRSFGTGMLSGMAACGGLALLTRASTGVGLIVAFLLLLLVLALQPTSSETEANEATFLRLCRALVAPRTLVPPAILAVLIAATGTVNYFRWGNPATFVNSDLYVMRDAWPNFLSSLHTYGYFNFRRIPFGLIYYFVPVWVLRDGSGGFLFSMAQSPLLGVVNLPPSSFFLTDLLPFGFILLLIIAFQNRRRSLMPMGQSAAIAIGLVVPCVLMLSCSWMIFRYRMEFYPEIEFLALLGLYLTVTNKEMLAKFARLRHFLRASLMVSIVASVVVLALCDLSGDASPDEILRDGIVHYYVDKVTYHLHRVSVRGFSFHP
jgi:hypothetical protein